MTKAPMSYLGAVNRWAEGAVVLGIQTYVDMPLHTRKPWASKAANIIVALVPIFFILWTIFYVYGANHDVMSSLAKLSKDSCEGFCPRVRIRDFLFGGKDATAFQSNSTGLMQDFAHSYMIEFFGGPHPVVPDANAQELFMMFLSLCVWLFGLLVIIALVLSTTVIYNSIVPLCKCCKRKIGKEVDTSPSWPIEVAAWARLAIIMDNLTYWLFFWTAFFWIGFNSYTAFFEFEVGYHANYVFLFLVLFTSTLHYGQLIVAMTRATNIQRDEANNILEVNLDNIWRQTQLYYINAPLQLYAIINGIKDYTAQKKYGIDLSFWVGGDRGDMTTKAVKFWLLTMIGVAILAVLWNLVRPEGTITNWIATIILVLSALDVAVPATYLCCSTCRDTYIKAARAAAKSRAKTEEQIKAAEKVTELPCYLRPFTFSWYGKKIFWFFCENSCVVSVLKFTAVAKEFVLPAGLASYTALSSVAGGKDGSGVTTQLVAGGFTGSH